MARTSGPGIGGHAGEFDEGWGAEEAAGPKEEEEARPICGPGMEAAERTSDLMRTYEEMAEQLRAWGDLAGAAFMENQLGKERRRVRESAREDPGVQRALVEFEEAREAQLRREKYEREREASRKSELRRLGNEVGRVRKLLKAEQAKLADAQEAIDLKYEVKRVGLYELGQGQRSCGGVEGRKGRLAVLTRAATLGAGLSRAQKADFEWFKREGDAAGAADFQAKWPETFATWVQGVVDEYLAGNTRAFSLFMESETRRRLAGSLALALPGADRA